MDARRPRRHVEPDIPRGTRRSQLGRSSPFLIRSRYRLRDFLRVERGVCDEISCQPVRKIFITPPLEKFIGSINSAYRPIRRASATHHAFCKIFRPNHPSKKRSNFWLNTLEKCCTQRLSATSKYVGTSPWSNRRTPSHFRSGYTKIRSLLAYTCLEVTWLAFSPRDALRRCGKI